MEKKSRGRQIQLKIQVQSLATKFTVLQEFQRTVLPDLAIWLLLSNFNVFELKIIVENDNCSSKIIFQMEKTFFDHVSMI